MPSRGCVLFSLALAALVHHVTTLEHLVTPTPPQDNGTHPFTGSHATVDTLKYILYCGNKDLTATPKCIRYSFDSNALVEAFVIDGDAYQRRMSAGQGLVSKGIIIDGSLCLGMSCEHTAELNGVQNWCLMFINIDSDLITANIRFQYEVCLENKQGNNLVLILGITCVVLVVIAFLTCLGCCCLMKRRRERQKTEDEETKEPLIPSPPAMPPLLPPPPMPHKGDVFFSFPPPPPMVSHAHAPFRHEPAFQMQPPLPVSHVPLSPSTSTAENNDRHSPPSPERRPRTSMGRRSRSRSQSRKIRFPI